MRSMLTGCALLVLGSCAALAQQDTPVVQGGSPNAPAPAVSTAPAMAMSMKKMKHHHKKMMMGHAMESGGAMSMHRKQFHAN